MNQKIFIEYLTKLAPEGETALFVTKKTFGENKVGFIAALPNKFRASGVTYGNTGSFILERLDINKPSASASNCDRVSVLVLDDIGTKSKTPELEPTWIIETSEGCFQWGYTFGLDDQPFKNEFCAAVTAIAEAGFTDPGMTNPVRNFRIPGSINDKPGRNNFESKLIQFNPEREFTLKQICDALGVVPGELKKDTNFLSVSDIGEDDVLKWLNDKGHILETKNSSGWYGVTCPNYANHSTGDLSGRYLPSTRAFKCMHGHCTHLNSKEFLAWVEDNGGPKQTYGLRQDIIASALTQIKEDLPEETVFADGDDNIVKEVEKRELGRIEKQEWFSRFAYIQSDDTYFDLIDRIEYSRTSFNAIFRHIKCASIHTGRMVPASVCYDENRQDMGAKVLHGITYAAGDSPLVVKDGLVYGNKWKDARPALNKSGDISLWIDHCKNLVPEQSELDHIWDMMAFKLQNPKVKINYAILHGGIEGIGKDTMWMPFIWSVCGESQLNYGILDNDSLGGQWGYQYESEILVINELREPNVADRRALANKLKPIIAAPPELLVVNRKGMHPYNMVNRMFVLAFSNDLVPIIISSQDRRWFCVWSSARPLPKEKAQQIWRWYKSGGFQAIGDWLMKRDVSAFNPAATPPMTEFKRNMIEDGMSGVESYLVDTISNRIGEFAKGVIGAPFHSLCDRISLQSPNNAKIYLSALMHALQEAGWVDLGRVHSREHPSPRRIFAAPDIAAIKQKTEIRRLLEDVPTPLLKAV